MAFTGLVPLIKAEEAQDAKSIKIWDRSTWGIGDQAACTSCSVVISYYNSDDDLIEFDVYELIVGGDRSKFNEFLDNTTGHEIEIADLLIDGVDPGDRFVDGYFIISVYYSDGSYGAFGENWVHTHKSYGCLAKADFTARKLPAAVLTWPMTDQVRIANQDIFLQRMYLDAAKDSADNDKWDEFKVFVLLINSIFDYYEIEEVW